MPDPTTAMPPDPLFLGALEQRLSSERLRPYRTEVGGDLQRALQLYEWNAAISAAFFELLGHFEVVLRNSLHDQLRIWHAAKGRGGQWYDDPAHLLDQRGGADIAKVRRTLADNSQVETPGKVVAELGFGFWRFLLDKRYQATLWAPCLQHAFPYLSPRRLKMVSTPVASLHWLRNRIAHHEPVHRVSRGDQRSVSLADGHSAVLQVAGFMDPGIAAWLSVLSRVPTMLASRPRWP